MPERTNSNKIDHLAFIMDGNRRWAKAKSLPVIAGHKEGVESLKKVTKYCLDKGISHLTVYAFSTENWNRNSNELEFLFKLLAEVALRELDDLRRLGVRVDFLGDISKFKNFNIKENLQKLESETSANNKLNLHIALNYGAVSELTSAINKIKNTHNDYANMLESDISKNLFLSNVPDPDLLVRTGGEQRLSNFLLWQSAHSELVFTDTLWPDFSREELDKIVNDLQKLHLLEGVGA